MASLKGESNPAYKHGHSVKGNYKGLYLRHRNMIIRCYSPSCKDYVRYGAKGITVCDRWRKGEGGKSGYECFLADMGDPPFEGASIDRKDTTKGYSPDNCRWATIDQQANNKVSNRFLEIDGKKLTVKQWSKVSGVGDKTILYRLKKGVDAKSAVFTRPDRGRSLGNLP